MMSVKSLGDHIVTGLAIRLRWTKLDSRQLATFWPRIMR